MPPRFSFNIDLASSVNAPLLISSSLYYLIRWRPISQVQPFFFLIGPRKEKKKLKFWNLPNIEVFFVGIQNATSFWYINISQKRTTLGKAYGIKVGCYCKHLWEHIENSKKLKK
jgi:hypothetical protein